MKDKQEPPKNRLLRILIVGMTNQIGGLETFIINICEQLVKKGIHFDFLCRFPECSFTDRIKAMGGNIYHVTRRSINPVRFYLEIHYFFKLHAAEYDVVWDNECMMNDMTPLLQAKHYGIRHRIYHSHGAGNVDTSLKGQIQEMLHKYHRRTVDLVATDLWACSEKAAYWAFPKSIMKNQTYRIIRNAIPINLYGYNPLVRESYRSQMMLNRSYVVGNVGHLHYGKNQKFLLDTFALFLNRFPDSILLLIGNGVDQKELEEKVQNLKISEAVRFLGHRDDIPQLLQALDLFVMPSRVEGLGIAAVEAQIAGLPCILSDKLPLSVQFRDNVVFIPIDNAESWCNAMVWEKEQNGIRTDGCASAQAAGYDIRTEADHLEKLWRASEQICFRN